MKKVSGSLKTVEKEKSVPKALKVSKALKVPKVLNVPKVQNKSSKSNFNPIQLLLMRKETNVVFVTASQSARTSAGSPNPKNKQ